MRWLRDYWYLPTACLLFVGQITPLIALAAPECR